MVGAVCICFVAFLYSSASPDVRTATLTVRPSTARFSVFDRLGAIVPQQRATMGSGISGVKRSPAALPTPAPSGKVLLNRVVDRALASNAAEEAQRRGSLKRSVSYQMIITLCYIEK